MANAAKVPNIQTLGWTNFRTDMFGRTKVSNPLTIFDSSHRYTMDNLFDPKVVNGASHSYSANESLVNLNITTDAGSKASLESKRVIPYQPGKSLQLMQSFTLSTPKQGLRQRVGYFSRQNGVFFEQSGHDYFIVKRSFTSGQVVDERIPQYSWNVDPLNGSGDTDLEYDFSKSQLMFIEIEWLGVGSVKVGFAYNGAFVTAHQFNHANFNTGVYMTTGSLPIRYEIENIGGLSSSSTLKQICCTAISNGGFQATPPQEIITRTMNVSTTLIPIYGIRMASNRTDSVVIPGSDKITPTSSAVYEYVLLKNPTLTGGTWIPYGRGNVEYNNTCTAVEGGTVLGHGFINSSNQASSQASVDELDRFDLQLGRTNSDTPTSDVYVLAVKTLSGNGSVAAVGSWYNLI